MSFIVNIEISTSKIVGIVASRTEDNTITILATESIAPEGCIKRGSIFNIDVTAGKIKRILSLLENRINKKIGYCYVTLNPKGMKGIRHKEQRDLFNHSVTLDVQQALESKLKQYKPETLVNYSTTNIIYILDGSIVDTPIGEKGMLLEAEGSILLGYPVAQKVATEVITAKNEIKIHSFIWNPIAQSNLIMSMENMQKGCLLIDLGAGTTTATIYKDNILKYSINIPMGSHLITKDIASLGITLEEAENYKRNYVNINPANKETIKISDKINTRDLNKITKLRTDEILLNVLERLKESNMFFKLDDGIFLTGGGSLLNGMTEYVEFIFKLPTQRAKINQSTIKNISPELDSPIYYQLLGSLSYAQKNCQFIKPIEQPKPVEEVKPEPNEEVAPEPKRKKGKKGIWNKMQDMFRETGTFNDGE